MKFYITRRGKPDFVCEASSAGFAIILYWLVTRETPKASYRIHEGRRRQGRVVSSAVAYWLLGEETQEALYDVLESTLSDFEFTKFCETAVEAGHLLGK